MLAVQPRRPASPTATGAATHGSNNPQRGSKWVDKGPPASPKSRDRLTPPAAARALPRDEPHVPRCRALLAGAARAWVTAKFQAARRPAWRPDCKPPGAATLP